MCNGVHMTKSNRVLQQNSEADSGHAKPKKKSRKQRFKEAQVPAGLTAMHQTLLCSTCQAHAC